MTKRFATRQFVLTYRLSEDETSTSTVFYGALHDALRELFGTGYKLTQRVCYFQAPIDCCFYELDTAIIHEFRKYAELKGIRVRLDLRDRLMQV